MQSSKELLSQIKAIAKIKGIINDELIKQLEEIFPKKSSDIIKAIERGIIKNTFEPSKRVLWTAIGKNDEYIIYPMIYCSCYNFFKNVVIKKKKKLL